MFTQPSSGCAFSAKGISTYDLNQSYCINGKKSSKEFYPLKQESSIFLQNTCMSSFQSQLLWENHCLFFQTWRPKNSMKDCRVSNALWEISTRIVTILITIELQQGTHSLLMHIKFQIKGILEGGNKPTNRSSWVINSEVWKLARNETVKVWALLELLPLYW